MASKKTPVEKNSLKSEFLHRFKANPFVFIGTIFILILVIAAFVLVPAIVPNAEKNQTDLTFGAYDKVPITYVPGNYFARSYDMVAQNRQNQIDPNNFQFAAYQIWREAFEMAAVHTAILQEMKQSGYTAPADTVDREVARLPQFQENGRFSSVLYNRLDSNARLTLWRQVQDSIAGEHFYSDVMGLLKPTAEASFIAKMNSPQRSFDMVSFSVDSYPDSEAAAYAEEHADLFRTVHLSKITINSSEREARQILSSIQDGSSSFEDAAKAHSQDSYAEKGGDMGIRLAHELTQEVAEDADREKLLSLGKGEYSELIKLDSGWAFFRAEDAVQNADFGDSSVIEKVRSYIREFERGRMEDWSIGEARAFISLAGEFDFNEAVYQRGIEKQSFGPLPVNYGNVDLYATLSSFSVQELSGSHVDENFWRTAFSTPVNTPSEPLVQGANVLVLYPTEETDAGESGFESIESIFSSYWLSYMTEQMIRSHFLNSKKMEDRFFETFFRYFMPQSN
ncbi:MAG: SurA N-terminal domain-containing protein [Treponema sp.]|jgi:hypothetical protein|nr:SurA N-terminal domain-containing protein [Treponema sp.]